MPTPPALSQAQADEAVLLYTEHEWTAPDIAEHFGCSADAVRYVLRIRGVTLRPKGVAATPSLRVKQCTKCLHFLPLALFGTENRRSGAKPASWCHDCTNHWRLQPDTTTSPQPLTAAIGTWRLQ